MEPATLQKNVAIRKAKHLDHVLMVLASAVLVSIMFFIKLQGPRKKLSS